VIAFSEFDAPAIDEFLLKKGCSAVLRFTASVKTIIEMIREELEFLSTTALLLAPKAPAKTAAPTFKPQLSLSVPDLPELEAFNEPSITLEPPEGADPMYAAGPVEFTFNIDEAAAAAEISELMAGAESMKSCGLSATIRNTPVSLIEVSPESGVALLALSDAVALALLKEKESVTLEFTARKLGSLSSGKIQGQVEAVSSGVAKVRVQGDSADQLRSLQGAVTERQIEVDDFFDQARGTL